MKIDPDYRRRRCRPNCPTTLVSRNTSSMRIFAEVP